ncbi:YSC84-related protein, partial [Halieaceae bacterium]|nr:YSC84-related protein [Halieaceae bacterium]
MTFSKLAAYGLSRWLLLGCCLAGLYLSISAPARADSKAVIDAQAEQALERLRAHNADAAGLLGKARGVLVFPDVVKMGFGVGGQYGEGALLVGGEAVAYYATSGASFGLQLGAQYKSEVILFMSDEALAEFRASHGWKVGVDSSVAIVKLGAGGGFDSTQLTQPIIAFIFSNEGLM